MTTDEAIAALQAEIARRGKFNVFNILDTALGIAKANTDDLQGKLNELLQRKGVLTPDDEAAIKDLLDKHKSAADDRRRKRTKNIVFVTSVFLGTGAVIYFETKKRKS